MLERLHSLQDCYSKICSLEIEVYFRWTIYYQSKRTLIFNVTTIKTIIFQNFNIPDTNIGYLIFTCLAEPMKTMTKQTVLMPLLELEPVTFSATNYDSLVEFRSKSVLKSMSVVCCRYLNGWRKLINWITVASWSCSITCRQLQ